MADDDAKLVDELGDLLYQTFFLSLLLSERGTATSKRWRAVFTTSPCAVIRRRGRG